MMMEDDCMTQQDRPAANDGTPRARLQSEFRQQPCPNEDSKLHCPGCTKRVLVVVPFSFASRSSVMLTLKILAGLIQLHGPGATIQSDHQGIDALLNSMCEQGSAATSDQPEVVQAYFRRGGFIRGPSAGAFRRGGYAHHGGGFRRGFARGY